KEIINASKLSVFFIDEHQRVTLKDIGSTDTILKFSKELDAQVTNMKLDSQFRCNGSDVYISWLDDVLQIRETANSNYIGMN
ncbi:DNA/RNA helicase domain-containing protein, partial [Burkholderia sp. SIMBA_045]